MSLYSNKPLPFFELVLHDLERQPGLTGANSGYEANAFRHDALADYLFEWLPDFAMKYSELEEFNSGTAMRKIKRAAKTVYTTDKYGKRGEFGELILHALIREVFNSEPAISKIYYKSATNETVKGFDAVHVVETADDLELWLGEAKFYDDATRASREIAEEIVSHTNFDYLKNEFILIGNKIDGRWSHAEALHELISGNKSLDDVFGRVCIPALITYDSRCISDHDRVNEVFLESLKREFEALHQNFAARDLPDVRIHLFLVPLGAKAELVQIMHNKLEGLQR